jgi:hypothetical protein
MTTPGVILTLRLGTFVPRSGLRFAQALRNVILSWSKDDEEITLA